MMQKLASLNDGDIVIIVTIACIIIGFARMFVPNVVGKLFKS